MSQAEGHLRFGQPLDAGVGEGNSFVEERRPGLLASSRSKTSFAGTWAASPTTPTISRKIVSRNTGSSQMRMRWGQRPPTTEPLSRRTSPGRHGLIPTAVRPPWALRFDVDDDDRHAARAANELLRDAAFAGDPLPPGGRAGPAETTLPTRYSRANRRIVSATSWPLNVKTVAPSWLASVSVSASRRCVRASMTVGSSLGVWK